MRMKALIVILVMATAGACGSTSGRSGGASVIDLTWGTRGEYSSSYSRGRERYRDLVTTVRKYDRAYYERHVRTRDESGAPIPPAKQVTFQDVEANVPTGSVTTAGAKARVGDGGEEAVFIDTAGNEVRLSDYRGHPVVLVFTRGFPGYICPMCTAYTAQLTLAYDDFKAANTELLVVFPGSRSEVGDFVRAAKEIAEQDGPLPYPVLLDPDLEAATRFNIRADLALPATYIFDGSGTMKWGYVGDQPHERPSVERLLKEIGAL